MVTFREARPGDYDHVIAVVNDWWGGREMVEGLPRLFLDQFHRSSIMAEDAEGRLAGFLVGFVSPSKPEIGYVHYIAVNPNHRGAHLGSELYDRFEAMAAAAGCTELRCVTSPANRASIAFHRRIGFRPLPGDAERDGTPYTSGYDGPGQDRVRFVRPIQSGPTTQDGKPVEG